MPTKTEIETKIESIVVESPQGDNFRVNVRKCHQPCTRLLEVDGSKGGYRHKNIGGRAVISCFEDTAETEDTGVLCGPELAKTTR